MDERASSARTLLNNIVTSTTIIQLTLLGLGLLNVSGWHGRHYSENRCYPNFRPNWLSTACKIHQGDLRASPQRVWLLERY